MAFGLAAGAALLPLGLAAFAVRSAPGVQLGLMALPLTLLCVANPVWLWILTGALFDDGFRLETRHASVLATVWVVGGWHELALPSSPQGPVHWLYTATVLALNGIANRRLNKTIASELGISVRTVEIHRAHLMEKMQARNLSSLVRMAILVEDCAMADHLPPVR